MYKRQAIEGGHVAAADVDGEDDNGCIAARSAESAQLLLSLIHILAAVLVAGGSPGSHLQLTWNSSIPLALPRLREYFFSVGLFQCSNTPRLPHRMPSRSGSYNVFEGGS